MPMTDLPTPPSPNDHQGIILWGATIIISTLAGVVGLLWKKSESQNAKAIAELEKAVNKCEESHHKAATERDTFRDQFNVLKGRVEELEQRIK